MKNLLITIITVLGLTTTVTAQNQDWVWAKSTDEQYASNYPKDIVTDKDGNIYITGTFASPTIKFGSITLTKNPSSLSDVFIAKYDANGNALWAKNAKVDQYLDECSIACDANNNVFMTGTFKSVVTFGGVSLTHTGTSSNDLFIVKYDSNGNVLWAKDVDYTGLLTVTGLSTDLQGNAIVVGHFGWASNPLTFGSTKLTTKANANPFIAKFDQDGAILWARAPQQSNQPYASYPANQCYDVVTDSKGNSYMTGDYVATQSTSLLTFGDITLPTTTNGRNMYLAKYDNAGNVLWVKTSIGNSTVNSSEDTGFNITLDKNENVIVTGRFESKTINFGSNSLTNYNTGSYNVEDIFVVKYDKNGNELWAKKAGGSSDDMGLGTSCDNYGNVYVSGYFASKPASFGSFVLNKSTSYSSPIFVTKYDASGNEIWVKYVEETRGSYSDCIGVATDKSNNVYIVGNTYNESVFGSTTLTKGGIFLAKLGETQLGVEDMDSLQNFSVFPNPSSGIIQITNNEFLKDAKITVFNMHGQIIFESDQFVSEIKLSDKPSGMYLLQIKSGDQIINKKIIIE